MEILLHESTVTALLSELLLLEISPAADGSFLENTTHKHERFLQMKMFGDAANPRWAQTI